METTGMDSWLETWSTYDSEDSVSSCGSEDSNDSHRMEPVKVNGESLLLPQGLCDSPEIFREFVSQETFSNLSYEDKQHLMKFLPNFPERDAEEKEKTLKLMFSGGNVRFGNPLVDFHNQLQAAHFRPDVAKMRALLKRARYRDYKRTERWRYFKLVKSVLASRRKLFEAVQNGEKPKVNSHVPRKSGQSHLQAVKMRYFQELSLIREEVGESSQSSEDENYPEGPLMANKKHKKPNPSSLLDNFDESITPVLGTLAPGPTPWDCSKSQWNPYSSQEQPYTQTLLNHLRRRTRKEEHLSLQTDGISLQDVALRSKAIRRPAPVKNSHKKIKSKSSRSISTSSPGIEDLDLDDSSASEGTVSTLPSVKHELEEEAERVDIEGVDDLPSLPCLFRNNSSSKNSKLSSTPARRIKSESFETMKRPSIEMELAPSLGKKIKAEHSDPRPRKGRSESADSHSLKKVKVEPVEVKKPKIETIEASGNVKVETIDNSLSSVFSVASSDWVGPTETKKEPEKVTLFPAKNVTSRILTPATLSDLDGIDMMDLPVDFDESSSLSLDDIKPRPELMQETYACFFSLIRDILTSTPDHRIEMRELECRVKAWASSPIGPINQWYTPHLESQLTSAVQFLAGDSSEILPDDYVPFMEYKQAVGAYQWIGAGRDSDHRLISLCSLWLERGADRSCTSTKMTLEKSVESEPTVAPPPRGPAVQPTNPRDREIFRVQEKIRFENPNKSFTYQIGHIETIVGPVRSSITANNAKARGHTLLVEDRPKHITILELVRDAIARLPNSQGTRADIVTLLKDSQYLLEGSQENVLSSVVSGALDRLQSETDPCVKYDAKRKIWVYLHKGRSPEEFEMLHALGMDTKPAKPKPPRKPSKPKKETPPKEVASPVIVNTSESSETSILTIRAATLTDSSSTPMVVQARPTVQKVAVPRKIITDSVKSLLTKGRVKPATGVTEQQILQRVQQSQLIVQKATQPHTQLSQQGTQALQQKQVVVHTQSTALTSHSTAQTSAQQGSQTIVSTVKCTPELQKAIAASTSIPTRTILQDATISVSSSQAPSIKKVSQPVTITAEHLQKQGTKSIVKVIASTQAPGGTVRAQVQRAPVTQQQVIQLKQQLVDQKLLQKQGATTALVKKQGVTIGTGQHQQQQLIVMKQATGDTGSGQQQMFVINQQQVVVDPQLTVKQQKQLQQLLNKQQLEQQGGGTIQQQLQQLLLAKQQQQQQQQTQQVVVEKSVKPGQQGQQQMIVVKQQSSGEGVKAQPLQQMILVKQQSQQGQGETHQIRQQQLQQMLLLKQQQQQQQGSSSQPQQQQMIIVKQDQKAVQVIHAPKGQAQQITFAQLQQLHQQQRNSGTASLITHPRVVTHVAGGTVTTAAGASLIKPQTTTVSPVVAKVVSNAQGAQVLSVESILTHKPTITTQQAGVRMPVTRTIPSQQYTVVPIQQQRIVQTSGAQPTSSAGVVGTGVTMAVSSDHTTPKVVTAGTNVRIPGLNLAQIAGKQVLLASKPQSLQGQNVILGNSGGQTVLVASQGNPGQQGTLTVLQQGSQQILIPPGAINLKALQGLKVIPLAKQTQQHGKQQVFARIINPAGARPTAVVANVVQQESPAPPSKD